MSKLTDKQAITKKLLCLGHSNKEIALSMQIKLGTVKWHLTQVFKKEAVSSRVQLLVKNARLSNGE